MDEKPACGCIDLQKILDSSTARGAQRQADASDSFMQMLDRVFGKTYSEADPIQAAAIRQIMHREAPIDRA